MFFRAGLTENCPGGPRQNQCAPTQPNACRSFLKIQRNRAIARALKFEGYKGNVKRWSEIPRRCGPWRHRNRPCPIIVDGRPRLRWWGKSRREARVAQTALIRML